MRKPPFAGYFLRAFVAVLFLALARGTAAAPDYAVVVSQPTADDPGWRQVVDALRQEHHATVIVYDSSVEESLAGLRAQFPRYACFVARPAEATREFVVQVHRLTRRLDDDPYTDCFWGILTGYDAANALRIAQCRAPLTIRKVAAGTSFAMDDCEEGIGYSELKAGLYAKKEKGGQPKEFHGPADSTESLVNALTEYRPDLFLASGHATEHDWQIGYAYRNGQFRCADGALYGLDTHGRKLPIQSPNPKIYLPVGNCLMGHIDGPNAMALAWMNSGGVNQMIGYVVTTWYGYAGWGCVDYFLDQPGRYTFAEAFLANQLALEHRLETYFPDLLTAPVAPDGRTSATIKLTDAARATGLTAQDGLGLAYDRDYLAFYGDPAWSARMAPQPLSWTQTLSQKGDQWTFDIQPCAGRQTFAPHDTNGSQRGGRPILQFLPQRVKLVRVLEGADLNPVITDNFILVPNPGTGEPRPVYRVVFQAATPD